MPKYSETHHLNVDDAGRASVHVAVHLQDADPGIAQLLVLRVLDAAAAVAAVPEQGVPGQVIRPQTSGPCVHYDQDGVYYSPPGGEHQDEPPVCAYPTERGACPHLDNPEVLCPVKDTLYAMHDLAHLRDACEAEQEEQDADMAAQDAVYETGAPEWVEPEPDGDPAYVIVIPPQSKRKDGWSEDEMWVIARADAPAEAVAVYRFQFPDSTRTDGAIKARWKKLRGPDRQSPPDAPAPTPDFAGDTVPVTQCEEEQPTESRGLYGDARALHADLMDGMMCDAPLSQETEEDYVQAERVWEIGIIPEALPAPEGGALSAGSDTIRPGDRVALLSDLDRVGEVAYVSPGGVSASVQFPGGGPARVFAIGDLRRVV